MSIVIHKPGLCTTIQDLGRTGYRSLGIGSNGVMDFFAATAANYLVNNAADTPVIEMHFPAAAMQFQSAAIICIAGADFDAHINGNPVRMFQPIYVRQNDALHFDRIINGARVYIGIHGGLKVQEWMGSSSTHLKLKIGGFHGRMLQKNDVLHLQKNIPDVFLKKIAVATAAIRSMYVPSNIIRCIAGPEWNVLDNTAAQLFMHTTFTVTKYADRMGYRLQGVPLMEENHREMVSSAVSFGTVQLLPNGQVIILMADHQTTGGYPRIAGVITADLPRLAQLPINSSMQFKMIAVAEAEEILLSTHQLLNQLKRGCQQYYEAYRSQL
ncbi:MAG: biotin-dependent carboxyltransferase family protein [Bacteroidetes bacterium]|nr:biotin-dependent carboxyltransferase family protein [Bacteroidota bacterium]